jgi:hypothetical protein
MVEKTEVRSKVLGASVSPTFHKEVVDFCEDRHWVLSRFIERAVKESMRKIVKKGK